jgi:uncharacterized protein YsxB (DUF464 family)
VCRKSWAAEDLLIEVQARLDSGNRITEIRASGHDDSARKGSNLVCAACSALLRAACETLERESRIKVDISAPEEGLLNFSVREYPESLGEWLRGVSDSLLIGLSSLNWEYPGSVNISVTNDRRE